MQQCYQMIVIGGGPAGLAAACAAWDRGLRSILVIERDKYPGGILNQCIHSGFGLQYFGEELTGPEYADRFVCRLRNTGVQLLTETSVLKLTKDREVHISSADGYQVLRGESIVLATGCRERSMGMLSIPGSRPAGILTAGAAQAYMNLMGFSVGKRAVILGSGDVGLIMARRLTLEGTQVLACLELQSFPGGLARNIQQCLRDFDIPLLLNRTVTEVRGDGRLSQVVSMAVDQEHKPIPGSEIVFDCDTLLLSVGMIPENELAAAAGIPLDPRTGGALVYENNETGIPGIFACGNGLQVHDLADEVTEESIRAGIAAADFVLHGPCAECDAFQISAGQNLRYAVPAKLRKHPSDTKAELSLRVQLPMGEAARLSLSQGRRLVARFPRACMSPGKLEKITLPASLLEGLDPADGPLVISASEEEVANP